MSGVRIIGVGNPYRGDDGVGVAVVRALGGRLPAQAEAREATGEVTSLMAAWSGAPSVILVDAVVSGAPPGTLHRIEAHATPLPAHWSTGSSHALGLAEAIELARALGTLPARVIVFGVEAGCFDPGTGLSPRVADAVGSAGRAVLAEIGSVRGESVRA